jgi:hypothetical protein
MTNLSRLEGAPVLAPPGAAVLRPWTPIALVLAVAIWQCAALMPNADIAWYATVLDKLAHGQRLYVDVIETNPPFAVYLYWPAHVLAHGLGVPTAWTTDAMVFALGGASLLLCRAILKAAAFPLAAWTAPRRSAVLAILFVLPAATFGFSSGS